MDLIVGLVIVVLALGIILLFADWVMRRLAVEPTLRYIILLVIVLLALIVISPKLGLAPLWP